MADHREKIAQGKLARLGLLSDAVLEKAAALSEEVFSSDLETVRVLFADQHGILRGKTLVRDAFPSIFSSGIKVPSTLLLKDTANRTVFPVWSGETGLKSDPMRGAGDILLVPDPDTFRFLPWSENSAWIFCDVAFKTGKDIPFASRTVLKRAIKKLGDHNLEMIVGLEVEFHVFNVIDPKLDHVSAGFPPMPPETSPIAQGYQLLSETRYSEVEPVMSELGRMCKALGLPVRSMEVEMGPSQFEFTFDPAPALTHADNMMMFRAMVKEVCHKKGLHATFMTRPKVENSAASGWHLHQSLIDKVTRQNLMVPDDDMAVPSLAGQWIAGLLEHAEASCLLTTPTINGYKRYQPFQLAPDRIQWGEDNRGAMIRALLEAGDPASRIENRVAETAANPYYFFTSQILSGLDGVKRSLEPPAPSNQPYDEDMKCLPKNMGDAIEAFDQSSLYRQELGDEFVDYLMTIKRDEWTRYLNALTDWEQAEYFSLF